MKANERDQALYAVRKATKAGILPCLDGAIPCVDCGKPAREYDPRNYKEKLAVEPVCHSCNLKRGSAIGWSPKILAGNPLRLDLGALKHRRAGLGFSIARVAKRARLPYWRVAAVFHGRSQAPGTIKEICRALGLDTDAVWLDGNGE